MYNGSNKGIRKHNEPHDGTTWREGYDGDPLSEGDLLQWPMHDLRGCVVLVDDPTTGFVVMEDLVAVMGARYLFEVPFGVRPVRSVAVGFLQLLLQQLAKFLSITGARGHRDALLVREAFALDDGFVSP